ncbi:regulatory protein RecX [Pseudofulvibacter geojedonensis]|uniref:Regulatory protein RecX n=1 Tax=Pseudofulvibacter geojedonensis TaxID=1123758 RepID=A0ABW3I4A2_9FLAO
MNNKTYTVSEAKKKLEYYCAYQERCHKEVTDKLKSLGMIAIAIDEIIYHLIKHNYLNEERFAKSFARGKFNHKHWGKIRIKRELKFRKISEYNIRTALKEISEEDYIKKIYLISEKKIEALQQKTKQEQQKKIFNYLQYRGWENHLIYEVINNLFD